MKGGVDQSRGYAKIQKFLGELCLCLCVCARAGCDCVMVCVCVCVFVRTDMSLTSIPRIASGG